MHASNGISDVEVDDWQPRVRLRDLKGLQLHLTSSKILELGTGYCFAIVWSLVKQKQKQDEAVCVAISHQVPVNSPVTFLPLEFLSPREELLHAGNSACLHLHIYTLQNYTPDLPSAGNHASTNSLKRKSKPSPKSPLHEDETDSETDSSGDDSKIGKQSLAGKGSHGGTDSAHLVGFKKQGAAASELPPVVQLQMCRSTARRPEFVASCEMTGCTICSSVLTESELLLALTVDLAALTIEDDQTETAEKALLAFELTNGRQAVWPPKDKELALKSSDAILQPLAQGQETAGGFGEALRGLFRRRTDKISSVEEGPSLDQTPSSSSLSVQDAAAQRDGTQSASSLKLPVEVEFSKIEESIIMLSALQRHTSHVRAQTAATDHKLQEALSMRERKHKQAQKLANLRRGLEEVKLKELAAKKQLLAVKSSCKTARKLMQAQNDHLTIACSKLEDLWLHLEGPAAAFLMAKERDWSLLHRQLVARRCRLCADIQSIFSIQPKTVPVLEPPETGFLWHRLEHAWSAVPVAPQARPSAERLVEERASSLSRQPSEAAYSTADSIADDSQSIFGASLSESSLNMAQVSSDAQVAIGSLHLITSLSRQKSEGLVALSFQTEEEQDRQLTAALGYTVHVVQHIAEYLDVVLKYPLHPANCRSSVYGRQEGVNQQAFEQNSVVNTADHAAQLEIKPVEYSLHSEKLAPARFTHAVFLLNKDVEQLLSMHGLSSAGQQQLLQNLHKLLLAGFSSVPMISSTKPLSSKNRSQGEGHFI